MLTNDQMRFQILIFLGLVLTVGTFAKSVKIVGGENAHITEFPYMAAFRYLVNNQLFCAGSIVSRWNILTAAHCLIDEQSNYDNIRIYTGISSSISTSGPTHEIHHVYFHPEFTGAKTDDEMNHNDIAVIMLKERLKFNLYQHKVRLPTTNLEHHDAGIVTGWGLTSYPSETLPDQLQQVAMRIFDNDYCSQWLPFKLLPEQFCAYHNLNIGACNGDSGGPLVIDNRIVGIISFSLPCAIGIPDVFTRVYSFLDFIRPLLIDT